MAGVRLRDLRKGYGDVIAVDDFSLEVKDGEFLVLLGPSGCGKTTTLRCIAGLETVDEGEIYIGDTLVNDFPPRDRDVAMVFQSYALYPHMSVFDNIGFPLKMGKMSKDEIERKVKNVAELLRIVQLLGRKPKQLSGGEAQRVALGRALVRDPKVFLMDEPLSNLDAKLRFHMRAELKRLQKDLGVTTIYVTHDQLEAMTMADQIAIMNCGVLQQLGPSMQIFDHPANMFVAGFVGSPPMNFIDCSFAEKDNSCFITVDEFVMPIGSNIKHAVKEKASSDSLILGIRSENVLSGKERTSEKFIEGKVYVMEPMGSEMIIDIEVGQNLIKAETPRDFTAEIGEKIWLGFKEDKIHIFDKKTESIIL